MNTPNPNPTPLADTSTPTFVIVGHVNRGKSAIVSTLAADDSVAVDPTPGTTRASHRYPMTLDGQTLDWLKQHETQTADRPALVRAFVEQHEHSPQFEQEVRLLKPVIEGAAILYIVNSAVPLTDKLEAEMQILRYTGQPRMALINRFGDADYTPQWRTVLDQYFSLVRTFDAHHADFNARIQLLTSLRELNQTWHPQLDAAIAALRQNRADNLIDSAHAIAASVATSLSATIQKRLGQSEPPENHKPQLQTDFLNHLRAIEDDLRHAIRSIYSHNILDTGPLPDPPASVADDLFAQSTWSALGLTRKQLIAAAATAGALIGGYIDLSLGGITSGAVLVASTAIGATAATITSFLGFSKLAAVKVLGQPLGGTLLTVGPVRAAQFPWVLIDRAILYHNLVSHWAHGRRQSSAESASANTEADKAGIVATLPPDQRKPLERAIANIRKATPPTPTAIQQLADAILPILKQHESSAS